MTHYHRNSFLAVNLPYGRSSSPVENRHRGSVDAVDGWSVTSNSSQSRSTDHNVMMTRSDSDSWSLISHPTPSPRSNMSPDRDYSNAGVPFSSPDNSQESYLQSPNGFSQESHMVIQNTQSSSQDSQHVWTDSYLNPNQGSPLQAPMDDVMPFDFHDQSNLGGFTSSQDPISNFAITNQPWSPGHMQQTIHFHTNDVIPHLTASIPITIPPQYATAMPAYASQLGYQTTSPLDFPIMSPVHFQDHMSQRQSSPSSTNSYHHQLTPEIDHVEPAMSMPQFNSPLAMRGMAQHEMANSMIAQSGSTGTSDAAPSPPQYDRFVKTEASVPTPSQQRSRPIKVETQPWQFANQEPSFSTTSISPVTQRSGQQNKAGVTKKTVSTRRTGGRQKGEYKLPPNKAKEVRERREQGACWTCALQRDVCSGGDICNRCQKRIDRGLLEMSDRLCCVREKLYDFIQYFLPQHVVHTYDDNKMAALANQYIRRFGHEPIRIRVQPITGIAMTFEAEFYEFEPKEEELMIQRIYKANPVTGQPELHKTTGPPISLRRVGQGPDDLADYDEFLNRLTDQCMEDFSHICYAYPRNDFLTKLLELMVQYPPQNKDEVEFIRCVNKMLVVCFVLGRTGIVPQDEQYKLGNIHFFKRFGVDPGKCNLRSVPRMANRQIKYIFLRILNRTMDQVLRRLDRVYRSSKGCREWLMAFYGVIGLAMTFEDLQNTVHCFLLADIDIGKSTEAEAERQLRDATGEIDKRFNFMAKLFRLKYHRQFNPLRNYDDPQLQQTLGDEAIEFVTQVSELVNDKYDEFLCDHQHCAVNLDSDMKLYYGRLVAQFLCSFFGPSAQ